MSDSFLIAQPDRQKMTLLRESYQAICDGDSCAARLLNAMERWHFYKLKEREEPNGRNKIRRQGKFGSNNDEDLWVRMAIDPRNTKSLGWRGELMDEYSYKVILRALNLLIEKGYVLKRDNPKQNWDRTPQWLFQVEAVQTAVNIWGEARSNSGVSDNPDGTGGKENAGETNETSTVNHSASPSDSTRQKDRVESADVPSQVGKKTESTRQKNRSNNTDIPTQESLTEVLEQTSSTLGSPEAGTVPVQDDDDLSAGAEPHTPPPTVKGSEDLPLTGKELVEMEGGGTELTIPVLEKVPGGAALLALAPIPRQVLEARPARDPSTMHQLRALLFCSNKSRIGDLHTRLSLPTSVKGISRELYTRLTDDEIQQAVAAARLDVSLTPAGGFERLALLGLNYLIGEPLTLAMIKGETKSRSAPAPQGRAYDVKNERARITPTQPSPEDAPRVDFEKYVGLWELKANPAQVVDVVEVQERPGRTPLLHLKTQDTLTVADIVVKYRRPAYAAD